MIKKSKCTSNYTVLPNEVFDLSMSPEAIGVLCYLLSKPHDWIVYKTTIKDEFGIGRDKCDRILKELEINGYMSTVKNRGASGKFTYETVVYDKPLSGEPLSGKPSTANQHLLSTDKLNTDKPSKDYNKIYSQLKDHFISRSGKKIRVVNDKVKRAVKARLKEGYKVEDIIKTISNAVKDEFHKESNFKYVTLEYVTRGNIIDKYAFQKTKEEKPAFTPKTDEYVK